MAPTLIDVIEQHHRDSWGWALACCKWQHSMAEDVLQESYLRVLDGRARFRAQSSEKTWFFGVIRHVAAEFARQQARRSWLLFRNLPAANEDVAQDAGYTTAQLDESSHALQQALGSMPQRQREVLHLVFYAELTIEETAHTLGVSLGSARTHYHRGKSRLAELLECNREQE